MIFFRRILIGLWHLWFHLVAFSIILILLPFLFVFASREEWFPYFFQLMKLWSWLLIKGTGFSYTIEYEEKLDAKKQYIFCPNHVSHIDIPLSILAAKNIPILFVGKKEATRYPVFGYFYKRTMILVDRSSHASRKNVYASSKKKLDLGYSICIYPEGKIPDYEIKLHPFKNGAFSLAIEKNIDIVPISFLNNKELFPDKVYKGRPGMLKAFVHKPIKTKNLSLDDLEKFKSTVYNILLKKLNK